MSDRTSGVAWRAARTSACRRRRLRDKPSKPRRRAGGSGVSDAAAVAAVTGAAVDAGAAFARGASRRGIDPATCAAPTPNGAPQAREAAGQFTTR